MPRLAFSLLLLLSCSSSAPAYRELPSGLREVSGLALASPGSVFAHDDEQAIVHEIELATGRTIRRFSLGYPPARGDFEGIAADRDRIHLLTSDGHVLTAAIGRDGARMPFEIHDTGAGAGCEVEGLSLAPSPGNLLVVCKRARGDEGRVLIHEWNAATRAPVRRPWRSIDLRDVMSNGRGAFAPSAIEWLPGPRQLVILSARDRMLLVCDQDGRILGMRELSPSAHPQPEGLAVTASSELVIADEGERGRPARLTVYPASYLRQVLSRLEATSSAVPMSSKNPAR